jgi:phosphatidylserine/phosphatidylglycerophosphate/cardiolipin synthase-like enzyme
MLEDTELVGGVLVDAADPAGSARVLERLITDARLDPAIARAEGFEPDLVAILRRRFSADTERARRACELGAAWVIGRRSIASPEPWDLVASLPHGTPLPLGLRHTTAETLVRLVSESRRTLRLVAPFIDSLGLSFLADALSAATGRGVALRILLPTRSTHSAEALRELEATITDNGDLANYSVAALRPDAPWAHLKVISADASAAYIGSANVTAAGIAGGNLELGILVRGQAVVVVEQILDMFTSV